MGFHRNYEYLRQQVDFEQERIDLYEGNLKVYNLPFVSENYKILPGEDFYEVRGKIFSKTPDFRHAISHEINELINLADSKVEENRSFTYSIFKPGGEGRAEAAILLFHGLNEKSWVKYYPWAQTLADRTGKAVILFPLAFHMNRAPHEWSDFRMMNKLKYVREGLFHTIAGSSFANVAISTRLHILPQRFFWSGLQTFYDVIQLVDEIRNDRHPVISRFASLDFFSYSIGSFLSEVLMMSNPGNLLAESRLFIFCGGPVFNRMSPVKKTILDSEANIALYSFFLEHLDYYLKQDDRLRHYFGDSHPEGLVFKSMIDYNKMMDFREEKIRAISSRVMAVALKQDKVVPHYEVLNTLKGAGRDIPVKVEVMDFPYTYSHENPFPITGKYAELVENGYNRVFSMATGFLK